jgi:hypothetical protein
MESHSMTSQCICPSDVKFRNPSDKTQLSTISDLFAIEILYLFMQMKIADFLIEIESKRGSISGDALSIDA